MLRNKLGFNRKSIMLTWLLSYLSILLLPVVMSVIVYFQSNETLENEIHQANSSLLKQLREVMDNQFQSMERLDFELTWNVAIQELLYSNKYKQYPKDFQYDVYQITNDLTLYQTSYSSVDSFYIYLAAQNSVLLPGTYRDASFAYNLYHKDDALTYNQWLALLGRKQFKGFVPMIRLDENGSRRKTIAYLSNYKAEGDTSVGTKVIMIDQSRILGAIENMEVFNKGHVWILNEENQVLASSSGEDLADDLPYDQMLSDKNLFIWNNNGEQYEVSYIRSSHSKLKYVSIMPSRVFWEKAEQVRKLTYMSIAFSLIGGGLLTYFFLHINYSPVRRLVKAFTDKKGIHHGKGKNEFHFIEQAVDTTLSEMDRMILNMRQQQNIVRSSFITRLLKGRLDSRIPVDESLAAFNMRFVSDDFAVMLLYLEDKEPFFDSIQGTHESDKLKLLHFIVTNVLEDLVGQLHNGYVTEIDESLACLINFNGKPEGERAAELRHIAHEAKTFLAAKYRIHLTLSVSGVHSSIMGISQAYMEALDAMEYKLVIGSKEVLSYEEIYKGQQAEADTGYYYPLQVEQQLINYVKIGDFTKAKFTLDEIIARNFRHPVMSVPIARCLMLDLVSTLIKTISEITDVQDSFFIQNPKRIERLTACETILDMQQQMTELLRSVCEYTAAKRQTNIQQSRQRVLHDLIANVISFIEERYNDPNLNISMIGSYFDMKPGYISKLFKDQIGEGMLDFINKLRISKAKEEIAEGNKSINEISCSTGFNDVNVFIRSFKKYEGITPGKYKETIEE